MEECPICGRELKGRVDKHHLVPHSRSGKETTKLHKICHRKIHSVFTEKELEKKFNTAKAILSDPEMQKFRAWVQKKDVDYYDCSVETTRRKNKRRR